MNGEYYIGSEDYVSVHYSGCYPSPEAAVEHYVAGGWNRTCHKDHGRPVVKRRVENDPTWFNSVVVWDADRTAREFTAAENRATVGEAIVHL